MRPPHTHYTPYTPVSQATNKNYYTQLELKLKLKPVDSYDTQGINNKNNKIESEDLNVMIYKYKV